MNLKDPESIRKWLEQDPERHKRQLRWFYRRYPEFQDAILAATRPVPSVEEKDTGHTDAQSDT